ncbi:MAG TPA: hypothetical protein VD931_21165 [Baekduia sp.]|nr:hypothetical protein [Baekduia sp.]
MNSLLIWFARLAGIVGGVMIAGAALARLAGAFWLGGFQIGTLLQAGTALAVLGCLGYLAVIAERRTG